MKQYIYKINCKDEIISDFYIGRTKNFKRRFGEHRRACKSKKIGLYNCIRLNGGWDNWTMTILNEYDCDEAEIDEIESGLIIQLKPKLNYMYNRW